MTVVRFLRKAHSAIGAIEAARGSGVMQTAWACRQSDARRKGRAPPRASDLPDQSRAAQPTPAQTGPTGRQRLHWRPARRQPRRVHRLRFAPRWRPAADQPWVSAQLGVFADEVPAIGEGPGSRKFIAIALKQISQRVKLCLQCVRPVEGDEAANLVRAERNHGPGFSSARSTSAASRCSASANRPTVNAASAKFA